MLRMAIFKSYYFLSLRTCTLVFKLFIMIFDLCILTVSLLYNKGLPFMKALNVFGRKEQILNIGLKALGFILSHFTGSYFIISIINLAMMSKAYTAKLSWIITWGMKIMLLTSFLILVSVIAFMTENTYVETLLYIVGLSVIGTFCIARLWSRMCMSYQAIQPLSPLKVY